MSINAWGRVSPQRQAKMQQLSAERASAATKEKIEDQKRKRYELQESKRAPKVQVDQKIILWVWLLGSALAFISSAIVSFNGITSVATFVGLSQTWMGGLFFFFVELMYVLFLIAYLVLSSRINEDGRSEKTAGALIGMIAFGGISVLANAFHTFDFGHGTGLSHECGLVLS
jgi:hypothetical protein